VLSTASVKQAEIDQQLQFFSSVGPIGKVHKEGTSVRLEKTAPANLEDKQHMQIPYAKLDIKLEEVFPAAMLRTLAEDEEVVGLVQVLNRMIVVLSDRCTGYTSPVMSDKNAHLNRP
jgi:hypothetical protein